MYGFRRTESGKAGRAKFYPFLISTAPRGQAGTQVPQIVADRMADCLLERSANIGGYFVTSELAAEVADGARSAMVDFLNAPSPDEVIFGQNITSLTFHL